MTVLKATKEKLFAAFSVSTAAFFVSQRSLQVKKRTSLARPLLILNRYETKRLCQIWGLPVYPDQTNKELLFSRNRVRKQLMPMLRSFFNPQIDVVLSHLSEALLLEHLCTELRFVKRNRTAKCCNLLWPTCTILQFWQTRPFARQHHVQIDLPKAAGRPRKETARKPNLCKIQENRSLSTRAAPASFLQTWRNVLSIQMVSQSNGTDCDRHRIPYSEGNPRLSEKAALSACSEHIFADRLFLTREITPSCQLAASWLWDFSLRHQYYYFPKVGCLVKLSKTFRPPSKIESTA